MDASLTIFCLLLGLIDLASGYTCSYVDRWSRLHYLYCSSGACCGPSYERYCCTYTSVGAIVGGVIGMIIFVAIVSSLICCCCACCPGYRYRSTRTVIVTSPTGPTHNYASTAQTGPYVGNRPGAPPAGAYQGKTTGAPPPYQA